MIEALEVSKKPAESATHRRPQILMLTHRIPYPPDRGDRIRAWNILKHLSTYADVSLACLTNEPMHPKTKEVLQSICRRVVIAPVGNRARWMRAGASFLKGKSLTDGLFWSPRLAQTLDHWADSLMFDSALVYCSSMMSYIRRKKLREIPRVVDLVDVDSQKWSDYAANSNGWKRIIYRAEANRIRALENETLATSKAVVLASDAEAELFRKTVPSIKSSIYGISNGVDIDYFSPTHTGTKVSLTKHDSLEIANPFRLVFVGVLDYLPNVDGLTWFAKNVWPPLRSACPSVTLEIVGRNPTRPVKQLGSIEGITVIGSVDDVRPYIERSDAVIAPLRIARGIQNKVLEAMAMSKPLIVTSHVAKGIDAIADEHLLVADGTIDWVNELRRLHGNPEIRAKLSKAARDLVVEKYTWRSRLQTLNTLLGICS